jgi:hypothetical protein
MAGIAAPERKHLLVTPTSTYPILGKSQESAGMIRIIPKHLTSHEQIAPDKYLFDICWGGTWCDASCPTYK